MNRSILVILASGAVLAATSGTAMARYTSNLLADNYYGGIDPYALVQTANSDGSSTLDSVGGGVFNVSSMSAGISNNNSLNFTVTTDYAGAGGTDGTNYGDLFLTEGTWSPDPTTDPVALVEAWNAVLPAADQIPLPGKNQSVSDWEKGLSSTVQNMLNAATSASNTKNLGDVYDSGDWQYAVVYTDASGHPLSPNAAVPNSGSIALYKISTDALIADNSNPYDKNSNPGGVHYSNSTDNTVVPANATNPAGTVVLSNAPGCSATYPLQGNCGYYYRAGEAVQYVPFANQTAVATGTYTITNAVTNAQGVITPGTVQYSLNNVGTSLGTNFAVSWAMTCANDIIQGHLGLFVPEPRTWAMLLVGCLGLAGLSRRARRC